MHGSDNDFILEAARLALENVRSNRGGPFGAVIVRDDRIIARGVNTVTLENDPTAHAEVNAIREAGRATGSFDLSGSVLYTSCEPCPMCLAAAYWARIERVVYGCTAADAGEYGFDDEFIYQELARSPDDRTISTTQIGRNECLAAFRAWDASEEKTRY